MKVLGTGNAETYILYTNAWFYYSNYCLVGNAISIPDPRATPRKGTRGVGGRKKANCCGARLRLFIFYRSRTSGFLAFGIG
jgi:hypothetical protein